MSALEQRLPSADLSRLRMQGLAKRATAIAGPNWYLGDSSIAGRGVFAGRDYEKGDRIGVALEAGGEDSLGRQIWNLTELARYCNHQRRCNTKLRRTGEHFDLVATGPIAKDEELTANYVRVTRAVGPGSKMQWQGKDVPTHDLHDFIEKERPNDKDSGDHPTAEDRSEL